MMTIALSTSMPMATMNEASDTRWSVPPNMLSTTNVPNTMTTRLVPMMTPLRNPMANISTTITISTDSTRLIMKLDSESLTRSGWKNTLLNSMPAGMRSAFSFSSVSSTSTPILVMSVPLWAAMPRPKACLPSKRIMLRTGCS